MNKHMQQWVPPNEGVTLLWDRTVDLLAADTPVVATGEYVVLRERLGPQEVVRATAVYPYLRRRVNVGDPDEGVEPILETDRFAAGWFLFQVTVDGQAPVQFKTDYVAPRVAAAPLNNDRVGGCGLSWVTTNPWVEAQKASPNTLFWFLAKSGSTVQVTFRLLPPAAANPIPIRPLIGAGSPDLLARYDFAGITIYGNRWTNQQYAEWLSANQQK